MCAVFFLTLGLVAKYAVVEAQLQCDAGLVEVDHWCAATDPNTGKCPLTKRNINGVLHDVAKSYPHGRTCSWPCGAPAAVSLNALFTAEYKRLLAAGKNVHESLTGGRDKAWSKCRSLCSEDTSCTAYTLDFKYFGCTLSTQTKPCGEFKYSCHTPANGGTWWKTGANCGVNAALHRYTVKACRTVDHSKSCAAAQPVTTTVTTTKTTTKKAVTTTMGPKEACAQPLGGCCDGIVVPGRAWGQVAHKGVANLAACATTCQTGFSHEYDTVAKVCWCYNHEPKGMSTKTGCENRKCVICPNAVKKAPTTTTSTAATTKKKTPATTVPKKAPVATTAKRSKKTCYSVGDPHFHSFGGDRFDNHAVGWQTLYEKGQLKIEAQQAKWRAGSTGVAINRAYRVTHNGQVTQGEGGQMPTSNGVMQFASPAVKLTVQAVDFTRLAWAVDKFIYNIFVTTAETDGVEGLCAGERRRRHLDDSNPAFPSAPRVSEQQAIAACAGLGTQSDNCVTDIRMANDPAAVEVIYESFKVVEETVERLAPSTTNFRGPKKVASAGALEVVSAVVASLVVAVAF